MPLPRVLSLAGESGTTNGLARSCRSGRRLEGAANFSYSRRPACRQAARKATPGWRGGSVSAAAASGSDKTPNEPLAGQSFAWFRWPCRRGSATSRSNDRFEDGPLLIGEIHAPECSKKKLPLGALIVHLNDAHHWTRERIAAWVADPDVPDESHAHH
jgi:hypothetical protein